MGTAIFSNNLKKLSIGSNKRLPLVVSAYKALFVLLICAYLIAL